MNDITTRERLRPTGPSAQITEILVSQARIETKMDNLLEHATQVSDHENRLVKLESFNGFVLWIVGAAFALVLALVGAGTWWLGNG